MQENKELKQGVSRRDFLKGASATAAGAAAMGLTGSVIAAEASPVSGANPFWMPEKWDYETDILVVGHGAAGCAAAIEACKEGFGEVMVIDAAPEGEDRGTSSVCGQLVLCPTDVEGAIAYQNFSNDPYVVDEDIMRAWAEEICKNIEWLESIGIDNMVLRNDSPEFTEAPGADSIATYMYEGMMEYGRFYNALREVEEEFDHQIFCDTRARKLIQNPETKEICGAIAETPSGEIAIKAKKGVILTCGGFEFNEKMMKTYFPVGVVPKGEGSPYNRGDGIKMATAVGADLWHMNNFASTRYYAQIHGPDAPCSLVRFTQKGYIFVGPDSKRNVYEEWHTAARHGKMYANGVWVGLYCPTPAAAIFNQEIFDGAPLMTVAGRGWPAVYMDPPPPETNEEALERGLIFKADTVEELAPLVGMDPEILAETVATYNQYCADQDDKDFGRGKGIEAASSHGLVAGAGAPFELVPIDPPYYALPLVCGLINSQGGPKRNGRSEILDIEGNPIPRLFSAGEMGAPYPYKYNGGGNIGEGLSAGRVAARSAGALAPWE